MRLAPFNFFGGKTMRQEMTLLALGLGWFLGLAISLTCLLGIGLLVRPSPAGLLVGCNTQVSLICISMLSGIIITIARSVLKSGIDQKVFTSLLIIGTLTAGFITGSEEAYTRLYGQYLFAAPCFSENFAEQLTLSTGLYALVGVGAAFWKEISDVK
jgi:hypothetical protein